MHETHARTSALAAAFAAARRAFSASSNTMPDESSVAATTCGAANRCTRRPTSASGGLGTLKVASFEGRISTCSIRYGAVRVAASVQAKQRVQR